MSEQEIKKTLVRNEQGYTFNLDAPNVAPAFVDQVSEWLEKAGADFRVELGEQHTVIHIDKLSEKAEQMLTQKYPPITQSEYAEPSFEMVLVDKGYSFPESSNEKPNYQREDWEKTMINRAFSNLKDVAPDAEGTKTAEVGKYTISFQDSSQTLKISDKERGTLYEAQKGQAPTVCQFSQPEKEKFLKLSSTAQKQDRGKGIEHE